MGAGCKRTYIESTRSTPGGAVIAHSKRDGQAGGGIEAVESVVAQNAAGQTNDACSDFAGAYAPYPGSYRHLERVPEWGIAGARAAQCLRQGACTTTCQEIVSKVRIGTSWKPTGREIGVLSAI